MDVVFGYEDRGKILLLRDYFKPDEPLRLPPAKLGFLILLLGEHGDGMSRREAAIEGLKMAVHNWRRERAKSGPGEYWYGDAALARWIEDLGEVDTFTEDEKKSLFFTSWWNCDQMRDARHAAASFLRDSAALLGEGAREPLQRAAALYEQEAAILDAAVTNGDAFPEDSGHRSAEMHRREQQVLTQAREMSAAAIAEIEKALACLDR